VPCKPSRLAAAGLRTTALLDSDTDEYPLTYMLTIKTTDTQHTFIASIVDAAGVIVTGAAGYIFTWSADDKGVLVSTATVAGPSITLKPTGAAGSFVLSCSASKPGSPTISGSTPVTVVGQTPDHLQIAMQS
jgi:hypothetical protein